MLKRWYRRAKDETAVLSTENELLRRILFKLLPEIVNRLSRQPLVALRQLWLLLMVLSSVASGYLGYKLPRLFGKGQPYGAE